MESNGMLVSDYFIHNTCNKPLKYQTLQNIERCLKKLKLWDMPFNQITPALCFRRLDTLTNANVKRTYSGFIRNIFNYDQSQIPVVQGYNRVIDLPSQDNLEGLIRKSKYRFQLLLCMYAGLRIGEACAVTPRQVKQVGDNYFLMVDRAISQDGKHIGSPKTLGKVMIPEWLALDILNMKPEDYWKDGVPTKRITTACYSISTHGDKIPIYPHLLRHWFATDMARRNVPPNVMMKQMRHSNVQTTMAIYSQVNNMDLINSLPTRCEPFTGK